MDEICCTAPNCKPPPSVVGPSELQRSRSPKEKKEPSSRNNNQRTPSKNNSNTQKKANSSLYHQTATKQIG